MKVVSKSIQLTHNFKELRLRLGVLVVDARLLLDFQLVLISESLILFDCFDELYLVFLYNSTSDLP